MKFGEKLSVGLLCLLLSSACAAAPTGTTPQKNAVVTTVQAEPSTVTVTATSAATAVRPVAPSIPSELPATTAAPLATTPKVAAPEADSWVMPEVKGQVLQDAQDRIQSLTGNPAFFTSSTDATGAGRHQVLDSNWKVCAQIPAAGTTFDSSTDISFASVKLSESCP